MKKNHIKNREEKRKKDRRVPEGSVVAAEGGTVEPLIESTKATKKTKEIK